MKMIEIELTLSRKIDKITGRKEIIVHYREEGLKAKTPSNLYIDEKYFQYRIDTRRTKKKGIAVCPEGKVYSTKEEALAKGYVLRNEGTIMPWKMRQDYWTCKFDLDQADKLQSLLTMAKTDGFFHSLAMDKKKEQVEKWLNMLFRPKENEGFKFRALYPIKREFVRQIFNGSKGYEYRKGFCDPRINTIVIYESDGRGMVVGEFQIKERLCDTPKNIWEQTKEYAGISEEDFFDYFKDSEKAYAYAIGDVNIFLCPSRLSAYGILKAPQNYVYLDKLNYNGTK